MFPIGLCFASVSDILSIQIPCSSFLVRFKPPDIWKYTLVAQPVAFFFVLCIIMILTVFEFMHYTAVKRQGNQGGLCIQVMHAGGPSADMRTSKIALDIWTCVIYFKGTLCLLYILHDISVVLAHRRGILSRFQLVMRNSTYELNFALTFVTKNP